MSRSALRSEPNVRWARFYTACAIRRHRIGVMHSYIHHGPRPAPERPDLFECGSNAVKPGCCMVQNLVLIVLVQMLDGFSKGQIERAIVRP
jgi:hypothetical protein